MNNSIIVIIAVIVVIVIVAAAYVYVSSIPANTSAYTTIPTAKNTIPTAQNTNTTVAPATTTTVSYPKQNTTVTNESAQNASTRPTFVSSTGEVGGGQVISSNSGT